MESLRVVFVGDQASGKTSLILRKISSSENVHELNYEPTVFESFSLVTPRPPRIIKTQKSSSWSLTPRPSRKRKAIPVPPSSHIGMQIYDTGGAIEYDKFRALSYKDADVVVMTYSIMSPPSFDNIRYKYLRECRRFCPRAKIILVGCKTDVRESKRVRSIMNSRRLDMISLREGMDMAEAVGMDGALECSAVTGEGIDELFQHIIKVALDHRERLAKLPPISRRGPSSTRSLSLKRLMSPQRLRRSSSSSGSSDKNVRRRKRSKRRKSAWSMLAWCSDADTESVSEKRFFYRQTSSMYQISLRDISNKPSITTSSYIYNCSKERGRSRSSTGSSALNPLPSKKYTASSSAISCTGRPSIGSIPRLSLPGAIDPIWEITPFGSPDTARASAGTCRSRTASPESVEATTIRSHLSPP
mmetsp:Transcript_7885/g.11859  ORF Transcript_7885/g.11859 Transcript_7885/m.11859 type:complete len:416 (-) Transcript_7885:195-1442(-)